MRIHRKHRYRLNNKKTVFLWFIMLLLVPFAVYFGWQLYRSLVHSSKKQVYLFVFVSKGKGEGKTTQTQPMAVFIKSVNINKSPALIWFHSAASQQIPLEKRSLAYYSSLLKIPIDAVVYLPTLSVENKWTLSKQLMKQLFNSDRKISLSDQLGRNLDLVTNLLDMSTVELHRTDPGDLPNIFLERSLTENQSVCAVAVINTTSINKLAQKVTDMLEKNGVYVVRTTSNEQNLNASQVLLDRRQSRCRPLASKLEDLLPGDQTLQFSDTMNDYRADIVILLGNNLARETIFNSSDHR